MPDFRSIRGKFIRDYAKENKRMWNSGWQLIEDRDKLFCKLNEEFGYSEHDGSFGIGCKTHVDQEYKRRYDGIKARFQKPYDDKLPSFHNWCRLQRMTVFEFLFFDNIDDEHLRKIAAISEDCEDWQLRPIQLKTRLSVQKLKANHNVGEIRMLLDAEIAHHHYANTRCRKFLNIHIWDLAAQKAILEYGQDWKAALNDTFDSMATA